MDQQLKVNETVWPKGSQVYASMDSNASQISELEGTISDCDSQPDTSNPEAYDASMLEQRRAYKIELQVQYLQVLKSFFMIYQFLCSLTYSSW